MSKLNKAFFTRPATELAKELIGKIMCRQINDEVKKYRVTETECYFGEDDSACHASKGKTPRTKVLFSEGGVAYVYLCYGVHYLFNVVTGEEGHPEAVLIRGVENIKNLDNDSVDGTEAVSIRGVKNANGPGKVTKLLGIGKELNGKDLCNYSELWFEDDGAKINFIATPRIGIDYANEIDRERLWRFVAK